MNTWKDLRVVVWVFAAVLVSSLVALAIIWRHDPPAGSLEFETGKFCLQLIVIVLVGGLATAAVQHFQEGRNFRRDERRREDDFLRSILDRTVSAYNSVKRVRRCLDAETRTRTGRSISLATYDRHLADLNALQLEFESLKRIAPLADKRMGRSARVAAGSKGGARTASLKSVFEEIESFLNKVIGEYQHKRHLVPDSGEIPLLNFPKLGSFLDTDTFRESTSDNINNIVAALQTGLLTP